MCRFVTAPFSSEPLFQPPVTACATAPEILNPPTFFSQSTSMQMLHMQVLYDCLIPAYIPSAFDRARGTRFEPRAGLEDRPARTGSAGRRGLGQGVGLAPPATPPYPHREEDRAQGTRASTQNPGLSLPRRSG